MLRLEYFESIRKIWMDDSFIHLLFLSDELVLINNGGDPRI